MQFNKLYNIILQSIITQDIESKIRKAIQTLIKSGQLTGEDDPKAQLVKTIIKRNNSIDINGKTKLEQLLKANQKYTQREQNKNIDLDKIKQFSQKKEYEDGVVTYRVAQTKQAQQIIRKIIDAQWGEDCNPWCLVTGHGNQLEQNYERFWQGYVAYPKHIAFQDGKLLAFSANNEKRNKWWDRNDRSSLMLKLKDKKKIKTDTYAWTKEQKDMLFVSMNGLIYNQQTQRWDSNTNVKIREVDIIDGHFPCKFGVIKGNFNAGICKKLISLQGAPIKVEGNFNIGDCTNIKSLQGGPKEVNGDYLIYNLYNLKTLVGCPERVGGFFNIESCRGLKNLQGAPKYVGRFDCEYCSNLTSFIGGPIEVGDQFRGSMCSRLTSLEGSPRKVGGDYIVSHNYIQNLKGSPQYVGGDYKAHHCTSLSSIVDRTKNVKGACIFQECNRLSWEDQNCLVYDQKTGLWNGFGRVELFDGFIKNGKLPYKFGEVKGDFQLWKCTSLKTLEGCPKKVGGRFYCNDVNLNNLVGGPQWVGEQYDFSNCFIRSLKGAPKYVKKGICFYNCKGFNTLEGLENTQIDGFLNIGKCNLESLKGFPKKVTNIILPNRKLLAQVPKNVMKDIEELF